jgi:signal transduction histidine kinase
MINSPESYDSNTLDQLLATQAKLEAEVYRHEQELYLLEQIRQILFANSDMNNVFPFVVERIASAFGFPMVSIYLLEYGELRLQARIGHPNYTEVIPLDKGVTGRVARTGQPAFIYDVSTDPDYFEELPGITSLIGVPLMGRGREVLGTLMVESYPSRPLDEHDFKLCESLAEHIVLALEQSRLFRSEQRRANQLALLNQIGRDLAATLDVETIIERVIGPIRRKLGYYSVNIGLVEDARLVYRVSFSSEGVHHIPLDTDSLATFCVKSGEMLVIPNVSKDPRFSPAALLPNTRSEVLVPLRAAGQVIGVLDIESDQLNAFDDDDIILLKTLADETSVALENARRFERLEQQSIELNHTNRKLAEANRLKSEFLANVSHELRTPLNSIIGYIDMIQAGYYGDIAEAMNDPLERVARNGQRLLDLIVDVLDLSNIEAGHFEVVPEYFVLTEIINAACNKFEQQAHQKGLAFQLQIEPGLPRLMQHDTRRLHRVLSNLLSNAVKFTEQGEIRVIVSLDPDDSTYFFIAIQDTGIGIPEAEFEHIFEEFRQVDGSTTRQYGGTGLGLALASRTCQMMGGTIKVTSVLGKGSTFAIHLPVTMPLPKAKS